MRSSSEKVKRKATKPSATDLLDQLFNEEKGFAVKLQAAVTYREEGGMQCRIALQFDSELRRLKACLKKAMNYGKRFDKIDELRYELREQPYRANFGDELTFLFRVLLAAFLNFTIPAKAYVPALRILRELSDREKKAIAEFVPEDFWSDAALDAYQNSRNGLALQDWATFLEIQDEPMFSGVGLQTGMASLDQMTGGLSQLSVLAGPVGSGKTSLALQLIIGALQQEPDLCVLLFSLKESKTRAYRRMSSSLSGLRLEIGTGIKSLHPARQDKLQAAKETMQQVILPRLKVIDYLRHMSEAQEKPTEQAMLDEVRLLRHNSGCQRCLIVVDDIARLRPTTPIPMQDAGNYEKSPFVPHPNPTEDDKLGVLLRLHELTKEFVQPEGFPILALGRTNKHGECGERLTLQDVYGSTHLTYDAQTVLLLQPWGSAETPDITPVRLAVDKAAYGSGCGEIMLQFDRSVCQFRTESQLAAAVPPEKLAMVGVPKPARRRDRSTSN